MPYKKITNHIGSHSNYLHPGDITHHDPRNKNDDYKSVERQLFKRDIGQCMDQPTIEDFKVDKEYVDNIIDI